jgi:hypothetical protein
LEFWANPGQGVGAFSIVNSDGETLYNFDPDFGSFAIHEFGIGSITAIDEVKNPFTVHVYPNPVKERLHLDIRTAAKETFHVELINPVSNLVFLKEMSLDLGRHSEMIEMENFPAGIYLLVIDYGTHRKTFKIIKQ